MGIAVANEDGLDYYEGEAANGQLWGRGSSGQLGAAEAVRQDHCCAVKPCSVLFWCWCLWIFGHKKKATPTQQHQQRHRVAIDFDSGAYRGTTVNSGEYLDFTLASALPRPDLKVHPLSITAIRKESLWCVVGIHDVDSHKQRYLRSTSSHTISIKYSGCSINLTLRWLCRTQCMDY